MCAGMIEDVLEVTSRFGANILDMRVDPLAAINLVYLVFCLSHSSCSVEKILCYDPPIVTSQSAIFDDRKIPLNYIYVLDLQ